MRARRYLSSDRHGTLNNHLLPLSLQRSLVDDKPLALYYLSHLESPEEVHIKDLQGFPDVTRRDDKRHAQAHVEGLEHLEKVYLTHPLDEREDVLHRPGTHAYLRIHVVGDHTRQVLSLIHISEPTRLGMISYAVF